MVKFGRLRSKLVHLPTILILRMTLKQYLQHIIFMVRSRFTGFYMMLIILVLMASACASGRPSYRHHKPRKPANCNCSRWSYNNPGSIFYLTSNEERPSGRA